MENKPILKNDLDAGTFKEYYYLKSELVKFCKENNLQTCGNKNELTDRVFKFLKMGEKSTSPACRKQSKQIEQITLESIIEENFVCSEKHRAFYESQIGKNFKFCVPFQKWLKTNAGKTYKDSIDEYHKITKNKSKQPKNIDKQFEYNTYIRDFFKDNKDKSFQQAVCCWNYKKNKKGTHKYDKSDLIALN
mgnify:FL=1